jgi:hypothetical protein
MENIIMKTITPNRRNGLRHLRWTLACAAVAGLCACGGGGTDTDLAESAREQDAAAAQSRSVLRIATRDKLAYANYFESSNGCESLSVEVFAFKTLLRSDGTSSKESLVRAQLVATDFCIGISTFLSGAAVPEAIGFRNDLTQASVTATVVLDDLAGTTRTLNIDLAWGGGELTSDKFKKVTVTPTTRTSIKSVSEIRRSETIAGARRHRPACGRPPGAEPLHDRVRRRLQRLDRRDHAQSMTEAPRTAFKET